MHVSYAKNNYITKTIYDYSIILFLKKYRFFMYKQLKCSIYIIHQIGESLFIYFL